MYLFKLSLALQFFLVLKYLARLCFKKSETHFFNSFLFCPDCAPTNIKSKPSLIMYLTFDNIALKYHFKEYDIQYWPYDYLSFEYLHCRHKHLAAGSSVYDVRTKDSSVANDISAWCI